MREARMEEESGIPLLLKHRTGNEWTAVAHIITGVIGSGVVSLPWSVAQLGWIAAPIAILSFALTTLFTAFLLLSSCCSDDTSSSSYVDAVKATLGAGKASLCSVLVHVSLYGYATAYTITVGTTLDSSTVVVIVTFAAVQIVLSQIPDFNDIQFLSVIAAVMSLTYAVIGLGLAVTAVISNGKFDGTAYGVPSPDGTNKLWRVSQALGDVAFSYPFALILFEIRDTLRSPPARSETMRRASTTSIAVTTFFYLSCGGFGYAAFGDSTPGNLMNAFHSLSPVLRHVANACIVLHLVGGYQIYSQPLFASMESWLSGREFVGKECSLKFPGIGVLRVNVVRLFLRTAYVASTTTISLVFPYFNQVLGVLGSLNFWPMTIYFPVEMYLRNSGAEPWSGKWVWLRLFSLVFFVVAGFALIGSIQGLVTAKLSGESSSV